MKFLGWIDHDAGHEEAILRALGAAKGNDARDELGLGTIRDSFADLFFPGISTIQQRLRYFLFVQWCCEAAAASGDAAKIIAKLRGHEETLISSLRHLGEGHGVIGIVSQEDLERMPSEIYWNGLRVLGIRKTGGNRNGWARTIANHRNAARDSHLLEEGKKPSIDLGFDTDRPPPPEGFPKVDQLDFVLCAEEAEFLRRRLAAACVNKDGAGHQYNLFGTYSSHREAVTVAALWDHPCVGILKPDVREMVMLAAAFARIMQGAAILYNLCVAGLMPDSDKTQRRLAQHEASFRDWSKGIGEADIDLLKNRLPNFPALGSLTRHRIDDRTISFVQSWTDHARHGDKLLSSQEARTLVSRRETFLKGSSGTSRIKYAKQRERWNGNSGSQILDFRWHTARSYLNDLAHSHDA